jgi:hypothetical protein
MSLTKVTVFRMDDPPCGYKGWAQKPKECDGWIYFSEDFIQSNFQQSQSFTVHHKHRPTGPVPEDTDGLNYKTEPYSTAATKALGRLKPQNMVKPGDILFLEPNRHEARPTAIVGRDRFHRRYVHEMRHIGLDWTLPPPDPELKPQGVPS